MTIETMPPKANAAGSRQRDETHPVQRILVVDDEPMIRQLNTDILVEAGFRVDTAEDGAAAWDALQLNQYDLLITDNQMPKVGGTELIERIRVSGMVLPVIMASATLPEDGYVERLWLQPFAMLLKPYSLTEFIGTVKTILHAASHAGERMALMPNWKSDPHSFGARL
jgi:DNA-binding response OmpR family regulator